MAQEKYLILGASSFYGSNFAELLEESGERVVRLSRPKWELGNDIPRGFDIIVNFACRSLVAESWDDPCGWLAVNAVLTTQLFEDARYFCERFIHVSTPEVYGSHPHPVVESAPFRPSTPYAVSRAAADMMLIAMHRTRFPAIITRTANIYGPGQQDFRIIPTAFAHKRAGTTLRLHGGGTTRRGFIHVRDACEATYLLAKQGELGETYHIAGRDTLTIRELVERIGCTIGNDVTDRRGKDLCYWLDTDKIRALGWTDTITLEQGLEEYGASLRPAS